jgi:hypothetical protein
MLSPIPFGLPLAIVSMLNSQSAIAFFFASGQLPTNWQAQASDAEKFRIVWFSVFISYRMETFADSFEGCDFAQPCRNRIIPKDMIPEPRHRWNFLSKPVIIISIKLS